MFCRDCNADKLLVLKGVYQITAHGHSTHFYAAFISSFLAICLRVKLKKVLADLVYINHSDHCN